MRLLRPNTNDAILVSGWNNLLTSLLCVCPSTCPVLECMPWSKYVKSKNSIAKDIFLCFLYISFLLHLQVQVIKWIDVAFIKLWRYGVLLCEYHFIYSIWIGKKSFVCFQQPFVHIVKCTDRAFWQNHRKFSAEYLISS